MTHAEVVQSQPDDSFTVEPASSADLRSILDLRSYVLIEAYKGTAQERPVRKYLDTEKDRLPERLASVIAHPDETEALIVARTAFSLVGFVRPNITRDLARIDELYVSPRLPEESEVSDALLAAAERWLTERNDRQAEKHGFVPEALTKTIALFERHWYKMQRATIFPPSGNPIVEVELIRHGPTAPAQIN